MDKNVYIYNGMLVIKNNELFCHLQQHGWNWIVSCLVKKVRERQTLCYHLPVESKTIKMKDCNKIERLIDVEKKLVVTSEERKRRRRKIGI